MFRDCIHRAALNRKTAAFRPRATIPLRMNVFKYLRQLHLSMVLSRCYSSHAFPVCALLPPVLSLCSASWRF
eukprot:jgi/Mesvir1/15400/Mv26330-RA.1